MIRLLIVPMVTTQEGATALHIASQEGYVTIVRLLLEKGADVNICSKVVMDLYHVHECGHDNWLYVTYVCIQRTLCRLTAQTLLKDGN